MGFFSTVESFAPDRNLVLWQLNNMKGRIFLYWTEAPLEPVLIAVSAIAALLRRQASDRHWLWLLGLLLLGYTLLGSDPQISHTIYGLPIWLAGLGPLVAYGWKRQPWAFGIWHLGAFLVVASLVLNSTLQELVINTESRRYFDAEYTEEADVIRQYTEPGDAIIAPPIYVPYLIDHTRIFLHNYQPGVLRGPLLAEEDPNHYWQTILLETQPAIRIDPANYVNPELDVQIDYTYALHAEKIVPHIWWIDWDAWVIDLSDPPAELDTPLTLYAHQLPETAAAGDTLSLVTVWINREALDQAVEVTVSLSDESGESVAEVTEPLISGRAGTSTSEWSQPSFHDAAFELALPANLPAGDYTVQVSVVGHPDLRQPHCTVTLGTLTVAQR
jgi:hypothetical protein